MIFTRIFAFRLMQRVGTKRTGRMSSQKSFICGLIVFVISAFLYIFWTELLDFVINWQMQLKDGNFIFATWKDVPFPLQIKIHVFQITNGRDFQEGRAWPKVSEVGPFHFNEYRKRDIHSWSTDYGLVKYSEHLRFEFDESQSVGPLSQPVTVINTPLLLILGFVESKVTQFYMSMFSPIVNNVVVMIFRMFNENLVEVRTVEDVLNGRQVGILKMVDMMSSPLRSLGINVPAIGVGMYKLTESSFGFIRMRNNQTFGPAEVYTGQTTSGRFNYLRSIEDKTSLSFFRAAQCNELKGTEGTFFGPRPPTGPNATLYLFNQHLCRPLKLIFEKESSVQMINTFRYLMDHKQFSILSQPENWCFCPEDETVSRCEGVLFMKQCLEGAPLALSNPHFMSSRHLLAKVRGLEPDPEKHLGFLEVERILGSTTDVALRVQLNIDMKPYSAVSSLSKFRPVIMPWIWIEEGTVVQGYLKYLLMGVSNGMVFAEEGFILMGAMGALIMLNSLAMLVIRQIKNNLKVMPEESEDTEQMAQFQKQQHVYNVSQNRQTQSNFKE